MMNPNDPAVHCSACRDGHLTKREYFSAMAMQGMIQHKDKLPEYWNEDQRSNYVKASCQLADALIAELNKEPKNEA